MLRRPIHDEVMGLASRLAQECHPQVALQHAEARARMRADVSMRRSGVLSWAGTSLSVAMFAVCSPRDVHS